MATYMYWNYISIIIYIVICYFYNIPGCNANSANQCKIYSIIYIRLVNNVSGIELYSQL